MSKGENGCRGGGEGEGLAAAAIAGDAAALREVWEQNRRWLAAILLAYKPREAELDDLLQDVAAIVVSRIGEVREAGALRPWMRTVAISVAQAAGRKQSRRAGAWLKRVVGWRIGPEPEQEEDAAPREAVMEEGRRLLELAAELPEGYREPLLLKCVRGLSYRQIGEVMGIAETTVETRIARGRRMLRELAEEPAKSQSAKRKAHMEAVG